MTTHILIRDDYSHINKDDYSRIFIGKGENEALTFACRNGFENNIRLHFSAELGTRHIIYCTYNCMEDVIPGAGPYTQLLPGLVVRAGQSTGRYTQ